MLTCLHPIYHPMHDSCCVIYCKDALNNTHSICSTCQRAYGSNAAMYDIKQSGISVMTPLRVSLNHTFTEYGIILNLKYSYCLKYC